MSMFESKNEGHDGGESVEPSSHLDLILEGLLTAEDPNESYTNWKTIGHGGTAEVYKAFRVDDKGESDPVAIKKFRTQSTTLAEIGNELRTLKKVSSHSHVNAYIEGYVWENNIYVVLEYCAGSCTDILQLFKEPLREAEIAAICRHCLEALNFIHSKCHIVHRDIKAGNLLLRGDGKILLGDFGISKLFDDTEKTNTFIGSPYWMAPEVILAMETGTYSYPVDIWSLGITLIELAETKPPHFDLHGMSACYRIASGDPPTLKDPNWTTNFNDFLSRCLVSNPEERWSAKQLLEHDFACNVEPTGAQEVLRDLLTRSKAAVKAVDYTALTETGLIVNIPPKLAEEDNQSESETKSESVNFNDGGDTQMNDVDYSRDDIEIDNSGDIMSEDEQTTDIIATEESITRGSAPPSQGDKVIYTVEKQEIDDETINEGAQSNPLDTNEEEEESNFGFGDNTSPEQSPPKQGVSQVEDVPSAVDPRGIALHDLPKASLISPIREKRQSFVDQAAKDSPSPKAPLERNNGKDPMLNSSSVPKATTATTLKQADKSRVASKSDTLKLRAQLENERNRAMMGGGLLLKQQMRAIAKLRAKHTGELDQILEKQKQEHDTLLKSQANEKQSLLKMHGAALKDFAKESDQEQSKLRKGHATSKKKVEDALKSSWSHHRKALMSKLKQQLADLKKQYKALKESKQQIADLLDSARDQELESIENTEKRYNLLETTILQAKQKIEETEHNMTRLKLEFQMREVHLEELVKLETDHKTGAVYSMQRRHLTQFHKRQQLHQTERQSLILDLHIGKVRTVMTEMEKQHHTQVKQLKSTLKKLPVVDEKVVKLFQERESRRGSPVDFDVNFRNASMKRQKSAGGTMSKESLRGLKSAKEEHAKLEQFKLTEQQMQMLEERREQTQAETEMLEKMHKSEKTSLEQTQESQLRDLDEKFRKTKASTTQYIAMQKKNFTALRSDKMKKPMKKAATVIASHTSILRSTVADTIMFYSDESRLKLRPPVLKELVFDLAGPLPEVPKAETTSAKSIPKSPTDAKIEKTPKTKTKAKAKKQSRKATKLV